MKNVTQKTANILYRSKDILGRLVYPTAFFLRSDPRLVQKKTEIAIEGFPRSGNSATVERFLVSQGRRVELAHHLHQPIQIKLASQYSVPCLILFREPQASVVSLKAFGYEWMLRSGNGVMEVHASFDTLFSYWRNYYREAMKYKQTVIFAEIDFAIHNFNAVMERVNERWETEFKLEIAPYDGSRRGWHATPSPVRKPIKQFVEDSLERRVSQDEYLERLIGNCDIIYDNLLQLQERSLKDFTE